jgi:DNA helicase-4|tara:strand:+ start:7197 stop:9929 length:2733 start_codon:yes stop_codon:yes gene_type:complete
METVHKVKPNFFQKLFGAKELRLNIKNYLISVSHNKNNQFDQKKITNIKLKKGIFFNDIDVVFEKSIQKINKLTKNQSNYYIFILKNLEIIKKAYEDILNLTICKKYINHKKIEKWIIENKEILKFLKKSNKNSLGITELKILKFYKNMETTIDSKNKYFVAQEIKKFKSLFDKIEDNPLTLAQRKAIVTDEDSTLVVAGAGTGKTSTVVGKVSYLVTKNEIKNNEILALAFGKAAAQEMRDRVKKKTGIDIEIRTFHSTGKKIIESIKGRKLKISDRAAYEKAKMVLFTDILRSMLKDKNSKTKIFNFISKHRFPAKYLEDFKSDSDYFEYMRKFELDTLKGEKVKSFEELLIADWLFLNGIYYEYEFPYEHNTSSRKRGQYRPDFKLFGTSKKQIENGFYLEHFGIDREGKTAPQISEEGYNRQITWKRNLHKRKNTILIETYSWERMEGVILKDLEKKLIQNGIEPNPNDPEIEKLLFEREEVNKRLVSLVSDFLGIYKEGQYTKEEMLKSLSKIEINEQERYKVFLELFYDVFNRYQNYLKKKQEVDFADLLKIATAKLKNDEFKTKFKRIIVDEYQDISRGRYRFLKAIIDQQKDCRIMCVGDDWQSIYAFNGSDIKYTFDFEKIFGKAARVDLDKSFRFTQPILDVSSRFIQKNPFQLKKNIISRPSKIKKTIEIMGIDPGQQNHLLEVYAEINSLRPNDKKWDVLLLGRYNRIANKNGIFPAIPEDHKMKFKKLNFKFLTIHKSKGLGADAVVVLNLEAGKYGFPGYIENDPIMNLVRPGEQDFKNAEERRVLYVALTRAKQKVILCANNYFPSEFIEELKTYPEVTYDEKSIINKALLSCPSCTKGKLYLKRPKRINGYAWRCSLEPHCKGEAKFCPNCKTYPAIHHNRCIDPRCEKSKLET